MLKIIKYIIVMLLIGIFTTNIMIYKEVSSVKGDLNNDGEVDIVDLLLMKKYLIDKDEQEINRYVKENKSSLNYQEIGFIIDDILKRNIGKTYYVGKWDYYEYELNGKNVKLETLQMKTCFKVYVADLIKKIDQEVNMKEEIYKDIPNYEGLYQVSNFGNVKSIFNEKLLKPYVRKTGYVHVLLSKDGKIKCYTKRFEWQFYKKVEQHN